MMTKSVFTSRYELFRRMIVDERKQSCLSQEQLANRLSRPQSFVSKYERGERRLDVVEFLEVAAALGIDPSSFIERLARGRRDFG
jgi:transcriptional regulator with XRE-family HTH domain